MSYFNRMLHRNYRKPKPLTHSPWPKQPSHMGHGRRDNSPTLPAPSLSLSLICRAISRARSHTVWRHCVCETISKVPLSISPLMQRYKGTRLHLLSLRWKLLKMHWEQLKDEERPPLFCGYKITMSCRVWASNNKFYMQY